MVTLTLLETLAAQMDQQAAAAEQAGRSAILSPGHARNNYGCVSHHFFMGPDPATSRLKQSKIIQCGPAPTRSVIIISDGEFNDARGNPKYRHKDWAWFYSRPFNPNTCMSTFDSRIGAVSGFLIMMILCDPHDPTCLPACSAASGIQIFVVFVILVFDHWMNVYPTFERLACLFCCISIGQGAHAERLANLAKQSGGVSIPISHEGNASECDTALRDLVLDITDLYYPIFFQGSPPHITHTFPRQGNASGNASVCSTALRDLVRFMQFRGLVFEADWHECIVKRPRDRTVGSWLGQYYIEELDSIVIVMAPRILVE
ncbi:hypothetical protein PAPYR_10732 [Paratrimastix pyriformis]|uniref:Uncharacterized protein n=1 Tax=Paratrimastix pyriformis TaxID=342808 RepID=A0ABQ8U9K9_9EUKA|nr:hypothetical protein PAPYR_10732 [Paratrimastix pyriformis]